MRRFCFLAVAAIASCASSIPAQALNTRTWISGKGVDQTGCGPITSPCRTLQFAHDATSAGGEIDVLDPAGYGAVTITKGISIINEGVGVAGALAPSGGTAITINAGASETVALRGLTVEGAGVGENGIVFNSGSALEISNCTVGGFTGSGISLLPPQETIFTITNTAIAKNGGNGIAYAANNSSRGSRISIDHVAVTDNARGMQVSTVGSPAWFTITNSMVSSNATSGAQMSGGFMHVSADQSIFSNNSEDGILVSSGALDIGRSVLSDNGNFSSGSTGYGINNIAGVVQSYGDNRFNANRLGATSGSFSSAALK